MWKMLLVSTGIAVPVLIYGLILLHQGSKKARGRIYFVGPDGVATSREQGGTPWVT